MPPGFGSDPDRKTFQTTPRDPIGTIVGHQGVPHPAIETLG